MRHDRDTLPGRDWPVIAQPQDGRVRAQEWANDWWSVLPWWKWWALDEWLTHHPDVRRLIWIDDHLRNYRTPDETETSPARRAWNIEAALRDGARIDPLLLAPDKHTGLRPLDLRVIDDWILGVR